MSNVDDVDVINENVSGEKSPWIRVESGLVGVDV